MRRILLTSAGQHLRTAIALNTLAFRLQDELGVIRLMLADSDPRVAAMQTSVADTVVLPKFNDPECGHVLLDVCRHGNVVAIVPMSDSEFDLLGQARRELERAGVKVVMPGYDQVLLCRDKWAFARKLANLGWPHPGTELLSEVDPETLRYPVFVKDVDSTVSRGHYHYVPNDDKLRALMAYIGEEKTDVVVQKYVDRPQYWAQLVCDDEHQVVAAVTAKSALTRGWTDWVYTTPWEPELVVWYQLIASTFKLVGAVVVDFWWDGKTDPMICEINTRMGTHWCFIGAMNASEPDGVGTALLKVALGEPVKPKAKPWHKEIVCHVYPDVTWSPVEKFPGWENWQNTEWTT